MNIEINDRLYNDFVIWAQANNMNDNDIQKYIEKAFRNKFTLDKYGDLNEQVQETTLTKKTRKTTKKTEPTPSEPINEPNNEPNNEPINEPNDEPIKEEKPKRKTKVIATK